MKLKHFFFLTLFFTFTSTFSYATQADIFVQSTVNRASSLLSENISREEKINQLQIIAKETVDIKGIGFYTLGPIRENSF